MFLNKKLIIPLLSVTILLTGCLMKNETEKDNMVSVEDYTGQGYELPNGEENDKIAEAHRKEIDKATKQFFLDKYKTKVKVHNIVGNKDGATIFVESIGEPHFYTYAIVPINSQKKVIKNGIWTQEGQVETSIRSGIYGMAYHNQLKELDNYLNKTVSKYPIIGLNEKAIQNTRSTGFTTPYYYISVLDYAFDPLFDTYLQNPKTTKEEWKNKVQSLKMDPEGYLITIQLFMGEGKKPDQKILDTIIADLKSMNNLPPGDYSVYLNDNNILADSSDGTSDNTIERKLSVSITK
ncbi:DUF1672 family protein [Fictibacillus barbaricus]|uniref:PBP1b-binding outer membrane lipoprotein LpoB n=1 Tax=Fictibacillus barbaricus TaxID=182136 RepID=A0ABU1U1D7_9BACL|nr:DUF1672 family protein [Fictibacillus barbaricus]MDR7073282.1 PBP1b-binding outer membrane lipoprotein LpoB [Fictibacillus barbaricus]